MQVIAPKQKASRFSVQKLSPLGESIKKTVGQENTQSILRTLAEAAVNHPMTYATVDSVARSVVGAGWAFVPVQEFAGRTNETDMELLSSFFNFRSRRWDNIKDYLSFPDKIGYTVATYRLFGQTGWEIIRNGAGQPVGFDVLSGIITPNVDQYGYFKSPAFTLLPWDKTKDPVYYNAEEIVYFYNPGIRGNVGGESIYQALTTTSLPSDLYASQAFRELFKNTNSPYNGIWEVDQAVSDDDYDYFLALLEQRYTGAANYGRNPLVIRGNVKFNEYTSRSKEDAPYLEGRNFNREEYYGVTGVNGNKLGVSQSANKSDIRESRREFHENVTRPLFRRMEDNIYDQVMVRTLNMPEWRLVFNQPDFSTALEKATIKMRELQWGLSTPNEQRIKEGKDPLPGGDVRFFPINMAWVDEEGQITMMTGNSQYAPEDDGSDEGESDPNSDDVRPPRDDENPDSTNVLKEVRQWRKCHLRAMDGKREEKDFQCNYISPQIVKMIKSQLSACKNDFEITKKIFDSLEELVLDEQQQQTKALALSDMRT